MVFHLLIFHWTISLKFVEIEANVEDYGIRIVTRITRHGERHGETRFIYFLSIIDNIARNGSHSIQMASAKKVGKSVIVARQGSKVASQMTRKTSKEAINSAPVVKPYLPKNKECRELPNYAASVLGGLEVMWRQGALCDVLLHVEGVAFSAHKIVLATSCDYFHSYFTAHPMCEDVDISMTGMNRDSAKVVLECIYTGKIQINESSVRDLLAVATRLKFRAIEDACGEFLSNRLGKFNCLRMLTVAITYSLPHLGDRALAIAAKHFLEVSTGYDFYQLEVDHLASLLVRDDLQTDNELDVLERMLAWLDYDLKNRREVAPMLLQYVRLPLLSPSDIVDHVESIDFLMSIPECQNLVKEALRYHCLPARQSVMQVQSLPADATERHAGTLTHTTSLREGMCTSRVLYSNLR